MHTKEIILCFCSSAQYATKTDKCAWNNLMISVQYSLSFCVQLVDLSSLCLESFRHLKMNFSSKQAAVTATTFTLEICCVFSAKLIIKPDLTLIILPLHRGSMQSYSSYIEDAHRCLLETWILTMCFSPGDACRHTHTNTH